VNNSETKMLTNMVIPGEQADFTCGAVTVWLCFVCT
jgi:hypothetical protein